MSKKFVHPCRKLMGRYCAGGQHLLRVLNWKECLSQLLFDVGICPRLSRLSFQPEKSRPEVFERSIEGKNSRTAATESPSQLIPGTWLEILPCRDWGQHRGGAEPSFCQAGSNSWWPANARWLCTLRWVWIEYVSSNEVRKSFSTPAMACLPQDWTS